MCTHTYMNSKKTPSHTYIHINMNACIHAWIQWACFSSTNATANTCIYTYTHTHTHKGENAAFDWDWSERGFSLSCHSIHIHIHTYTHTHTQAKTQPLTGTGASVCFSLSCHSQALWITHWSNVLAVAFPVWRRASGFVWMLNARTRAVRDVSGPWFPCMRYVILCVCFCSFVVCVMIQLCVYVYVCV